MGDNTTRRDLARRRAIAVMVTIGRNIENDPSVNKSEAAIAAGVAPSSFYRWLATPPQKIDAVQVAALADWLHETYGHPDFATLWRSVKATIEK